MASNIAHKDLVRNLVKDGQAILDNMKADDADLLHMAIGVSGEAGELIDAVKKAVIYNKPLDMENIVEELGDIEFYLEGLRQNLGITRDETIQANIEKLSVRYSSGSYSDAQAQTRKDKQLEEGKN